MNEGFKQRLVGSFVLLALGVILAPLLFDFSSRPTVDETSRLPPPPAIEPVAFAEPHRPDDIPEDTERELFVAAEPAPEAVPEEPLAATAAETPVPQASPVADPEAPPDAWVIQVGTFSERSGAHALLQRLIDDGYKAYARTQRGSGERELHLIFVGPLLSRAEAERQKSAIDQEYDLQSLMRRFAP